MKRVASLLKLPLERQRGRTFSRSRCTLNESIVNIHETPFRKVPVLLRFRFRFIRMLKCNMSPSDFKDTTPPKFGSLQLSSRMYVVLTVWWEFCQLGWMGLGWEVFV